MCAYVYVLALVFIFVKLAFNLVYFTADQNNMVIARSPTPRSPDRIVFGGVRRLSAVDGDYTEGFCDRMPRQHSVPTECLDDADCIALCRNNSVRYKCVDKSFRDRDTGDVYPVKILTARNTGILDMTQNMCLAVAPARQDDEGYLNGQPPKCSRKRGGHVSVRQLPVDASVAAGLGPIYYRHYCQCREEHTFRKLHDHGDCDYYMGCHDRLTNAYDDHSWSTFDEIACRCGEDEIPESAGPGYPARCRQRNFFETGYGNGDAYGPAPPDHAFMSWTNVAGDYVAMHYGGMAAATRNHPRGVLNPCRFDALTSTVVDARLADVVYFVVIDGVGQCVSKTDRYVTVKFNSDYLIGNAGRAPNGVVGTTRPPVGSDSDRMKCTPPALVVVETDTVNRNTNGAYERIIGYPTATDRVVPKLYGLLAQYLAITDVDQVVFYNYPAPSSSGEDGGKHDAVNGLHGYEDYTVKTYGNVFVSSVQGDALHLGSWTGHREKWGLGVGEIRMKLRDVPAGVIQVDGCTRHVLAEGLSTIERRLDRADGRYATTKRQTALDGTIICPLTFYLSVDKAVLYNTASPVYTGLMLIDNRTKTIAPVIPYEESIDLYKKRNNVAVDYGTFVKSMDDRDTVEYAVITRNYTYDSAKGDRDFDASVDILNTQLKFSCTEYSVLLGVFDSITKKIKCSSADPHDNIKGVASGYYSLQ